MDVLYLDRGGQWHVLDYKTAPIAAARARLDARQYYLQVGVYAAAVEAKTGQTPKAHLYYIHPGTLVYIKPDHWQAALARLEDDLQAALED
jgi:ATP-dependent exoDNAse (exonuclease V) beta subunit